MIPENKLSTFSVYAPFLVPARTSELVDYEWGGADLNDSSQGMRVHLWTCFYADGVIKLSNGVIEHSLLTIQNVTDLSIAFDLNMNPNVFYRADGVAYFWWYDTSVSAQVTTNYGADVLMPQISLDDSRPTQSANADIIMAYIKNKKLCMRIQRDRYEIEYVLADAETLLQIGMTKNYRFAFSAKTINTFDHNYDNEVVAARGDGKLDLIAMQSSYSVDYGDDTYFYDGYDGDQFKAGLQRNTNSINVSFTLNDLDFDYMLCFYRNWQHNITPFKVDVVNNQRELKEYSAHFEPDSLSFTTEGDTYFVSASINIIDSFDSLDAIKQLAESRNFKVKQ